MVCKSDYGTAALIYTIGIAFFVCLKIIFKGVFFMPKNNFERMIYSFLTVIITVHAFVFYSLYVVNGSAMMKETQTDSVIEAINKQGGVYMLGNYLPIWAVVAVELIFAFVLACLVGSPCSFKLVNRVFKSNDVHPVIFQTAIICATALIMCLSMSFIADILYYPYYNGFNFFTFLAEWIKLVCFNFPFALLSQLFIIQPIVRTVFKKLFCRDKTIKASKKLAVD